ncbi:concanavalin A-like lectin/glucanase [Aureobasidium pullulans]|uniref:Concanavalin A-like lectin/glucanase n=1 Tax=Aureobasidium pullulans TaxID=5580 RepID=A0A4S9LCZ9_AURPU|nr:concanavalin A-like lectin/glucanase [Aureobasidium pullulans]
MIRSLTTFALATAASALSLSSNGVQNGCMFSVPDVGDFNTQILHDWSSSSTSDDVFKDLQASTYTVDAGTAPFARRFDIVNIGQDTKDPSITLTVPGGQQHGPVSSAQITTGFADILYGSVRTVAKVSNVPGTTHGFSFYANDTQEVDLAFLTSDISVIHLTNEQLTPDSELSSYQVDAPSDAATAWHEYRVDWLPGVTNFYIDSELVHSIDRNVPTTPSFFLWNSWSNGNSWAAGPPASNSVLKIQSVTAYFNRTSVTSSIAANPGACVSNPFSILSAYYADKNVTTSAQSAFINGSNLYIDTSSLDTQLGGNPWSGTSKSLTFLYTYGTETRVFVAAQNSGTYLITPGGIDTAPGSVLVPSITAPAKATIDIISVVWGKSQISTASVWNALYNDSIKKYSFQLLDEFFGIDTWWGTQKTAVIWYTAADGTFKAVVGRENAWVKFA